MSLLPNGGLREPVIPGVEPAGHRRIGSGGKTPAAFEALVERWAGILASNGYGVYRQCR